MELTYLDCPLEQLIYRIRRRTLTSAQFGCHQLAWRCHEGNQQQQYYQGSECFHYGGLKAGRT
jgi:hypothetical protein